MTAEAQRVGQGVVQIGAAALVGHHVQIAGLVGHFIVDGGGGVAVPQGQSGEDGLHRAGGAQHVAGHGLGGAHHQLPGMVAEDQLDGGSLAGIR